MTEKLLTKAFADSAVNTDAFVDASVTAEKLVTNTISLDKLDANVISRLSATVKIQTIFNPAGVANIAGGETVWIHGTGFTPNSKVFVDKRGCITNYIDPFRVNFVTPPAANGSYTVYVDNFDGTSGSKINGLVYSDPLRWLSPQVLPTAITNYSYNYQLLTNANGPVTYNLRPGTGLPSGLTLNSNGLITGTSLWVAGANVILTPSAANVAFTVIATDSANNQTSQEFIIPNKGGIRVFAQTPQPNSPRNFINTVAGQTVSLIGDGFKNNVNVEVAGTTYFPTLSNAFFLTFTTNATNVGSYSVTINNRDGTYANNFILSFSSVPSWQTPSGNLFYSIEENFLFTSVYANSDSNVFYTITSGNIPFGSTFNPNTGVLSGNLTSTTSVGFYQFGVTATDLEGQSSIERTFTGNVISRPKITSISYAGITLAANAAGGDTVTVLGNNFVLGSNVWISNTVQNTSFVNSSTLTFIANTRTSGNYLLSVLNPNQIRSSNVAFLYSTIPTWSTAAGNIGVGIEEFDFRANLVANSDSAITYTIFSGNLPPGLSINTNLGNITGTLTSTTSVGFWPFTVLIRDAENQVSFRDFNISVFARPKIDSIVYPTIGSVLKTTGNQNVAITGTNFVSGATVFIGDQLQLSNVINSNFISFTTNSRASGNFTLAVRNPNQIQSSNVTLRFTYPMTWISNGNLIAYGITTGNLTSSILTTRVVANSQTPVTYAVTSGALPFNFRLSANGFIAGTASNGIGYSYDIRNWYAYDDDLSFRQSNTSTGFYNVNPTTITSFVNYYINDLDIISNTFVPTVFTVTATNTDLETISASFSILIVEPPSIDNVRTIIGNTISSFAIADINGGDNILITGRNFRNEAKLYVGNDIISGTTFSTTECRFVTPSNPAGNVVVTVVNEDGSSASSLITYIAKPTLVTDNNLYTLFARRFFQSNLDAGFRSATPMSYTVSGSLNSNITIKKIFDITNSYINDYDVVPVVNVLSGYIDTFVTDFSGLTYGEILYDTPGTYSLVIPNNVTSISAVAVGGGAAGSANFNAGQTSGGGGLGWKNNILVTPNTTITVVVGAGGPRNTAQAGGNSYVGSLATVAGLGAPGIPGGGFVGDGGGNGGTGGAQVSAWATSGGGGAGGYTGNGGTGGDTLSGAPPVPAGGGGGGGSGGVQGGGGSGSGGGGGGVGVHGQGAPGAVYGVYIGGGGGSGGLSGTPGGGGRSDGGSGGGAGGGAAGAPRNYGSESGGSGGAGAVRVIWGRNRSYPSLNTADAVTVNIATAEGANANVTYWTPTTTYTMTNMGGLGQVTAHGYNPATWFYYSRFLPTHDQIRYSFYWHFISSVDNETSYLTIDGVTYLQFTKTYTSQGASGISINLCSSNAANGGQFTWVAGAYSDGTSLGSPYNDNNGYFIVDTGWISHANSAIIIGTYIGPEQAFSDESSFISHANFQTRSLTNTFPAFASNAASIFATTTYTFGVKNFTLTASDSYGRTISSNNTVFEYNLPTVGSLWLKHYFSPTYDIPTTGSLSSPGNIAIEVNSSEFGAVVIGNAMTEATTVFIGNTAVQSYVYPNTSLMTFRFPNVTSIGTTTLTIQHYETVLYRANIIYFTPPTGNNFYVTSGTYSWVAPANVYYVHAAAVGGGASAGSGPYGPGAGGGGLGWRNYIPVVPGTSYTVTVGAGGTAVATNAIPCSSGVNGGDSLFIFSNVVLGGGGLTNANCFPGTGGTFVGSGGGRGGNGGGGGLYLSGEVSGGGGAAGSYNGDGSPGGSGFGSGTSTTVSFTTAGLFTWTAPATATFATVYVWGAGGAGGRAGGWSFGSQGGAGGAARGNIAVVPGATYGITVGEGGNYNTGNDPNVGGGGSSSPTNTDNVYGGGGGGYSGIFLGNIRTQSTAIMIAGGGGGGGSSRAGTGNQGGAGGGYYGQDGVSAYDNKARYRGLRGTQAGAGLNSTTDGTPTGGGDQGALKGGGVRIGSYGGAGGGGYWGGSAGGYSEVNTMAGGGGGSGYLNTTLVTNGTLFAGNLTTPGDNSNALRSTAGNAGAVATAGTPGSVIIVWSTRYPGVDGISGGGSGGGGGGNPAGNSTGGGSGGGGGGTGLIFGQGEFGTGVAVFSGNGQAGSSGNLGVAGTSGVTGPFNGGAGGSPGGGGGYGAKTNSVGGAGAAGAVRLLWGPGVRWPLTNTR